MKKHNNINNITRKLITNILIVLLISSYVSLDAKSNQYPKLKLSDHLTFDLRAQEEFINIEKQLNRPQGKNEILPEPGWSDKTIHESLILFINRFPKSTAALTAKFYLGLVKSVQSLIAEPKIGEKILDEIATQFPKTWQGKLSIIFKAVSLMNQGKLREASLSLENNIEKLTEIRDIKDQDFIRLKNFMTENGRYNLEAGIYELLLVLYGEQGQIDKAIKVAKYIIEHYPQSYNAERVKRDLRQFERGLNPYGKPKYQQLEE